MSRGRSRLMRVHTEMLCDSETSSKRISAWCCQRRSLRLGQLMLASAAVALLLLYASFKTVVRNPGYSVRPAPLRQNEKRRQVLVSYSFYEKDEGQRRNFEYFITAGMNVLNGRQAAVPAGVDFGIVISGHSCTPCAALQGLVHERTLLLDGVAAAWDSRRVAILHRSENSGMDFAAHNVTLQYVESTGKRAQYSYFIFLNSSVRGPFFPSYMPDAWQWTDAFTERLSARVKLVSSSIVCLPAVDAGGRGPKAESWAFAVDVAGLNILTLKGIFWRRTCKLCGDSTGIVVGSEYGMSTVMLAAGYNLATLMSRYSLDTDWRDQSNWACNDNVHPSRHGTYDGISLHPYETIFVKESWRVGEPYLSRYTSWKTLHQAGKHGTSGSFNKDMYRYAISTEGSMPGNLSDIFLPQDFRQKLETHNC